MKTKALFALLIILSMLITSVGFAQTDVGLEDRAEDVLEDRLPRSLARDRSRLRGLREPAQVRVRGEAGR